MTDQPVRERALEIIRLAFAPFRCVAEETDYHYFRFRVFNDSDEGILKMPKLSESDIASCKTLEGIVLRARTMVEDQGYALEPWAMPQDSAGAA